MANYQDEFKCILDEEVNEYVNRALGLLTHAIRAEGLVLKRNCSTRYARKSWARSRSTWPEKMGVLFKYYLNNKASLEEKYVNLPR